MGRPRARRADRPLPADPRPADARGSSGFEALARWQHPSRGLVLPVDFIALAEESELIVAIGRVILEKACRQAQLWRQRWPDENLVMSVNLSPRQFLDPDLANGIGQVLQRSGLEPCALELEITESSVMDRSEASLGVLQQLRALGVRVVLDDFGTGYSSLAYLRQLPLDTIKVDRSFVTDLDVQRPERRHRPGRRVTRPRPRHHGRGRGHRDGRAGAPAARARLRHGPGLHLGPSRGSGPRRPVRQPAGRSRRRAADDPSRSARPAAAAGISGGRRTAGAGTGRG